MSVQNLTKTFEKLNKKTIKEQKSTRQSKLLALAEEEVLRQRFAKLQTPSSPSVPQTPQSPSVNQTSSVVINQSQIEEAILDEQTDALLETVDETEQSDGPSDDDLKTLDDLKKLNPPCYWTLPALPMQIDVPVLDEVKKKLPTSMVQEVYADMLGLKTMMSVVCSFLNEPFGIEADLPAKMNNTLFDNRLARFMTAQIRVRSQITKAINAIPSEKLLEDFLTEYNTLVSFKNYLVEKDIAKKNKKKKASQTRKRKEVLHHTYKESLKKINEKI